MVARDTRFRGRPGLVVSSKGDARYLTDLDTGQVWELNETAAFIFETARQGMPLPQLAVALAERYPEVPRDELERDAQELLEELVRSGMLEPASS